MSRGTLRFSKETGARRGLFLQFTDGVDQGDLLFLAEGEAAFEVAQGLIKLRILLP